MPVLTYPVTYTVWFGVDLFIRHPSDEELADAREWCAGQGGVQGD
jgi:hypothetical protein